MAMSRRYKVTSDHEVFPSTLDSAALGSLVADELDQYSDRLDASDEPDVKACPPQLGSLPGGESCTTKLATATLAPEAAR